MCDAAGHGSETLELLGEKAPALHLKTFTLGNVGNHYTG